MKREFVWVVLGLLVLGGAGMMLLFNAPKEIPSAPQSGITEAPQASKGVAAP